MSRQTHFNHQGFTLLELIVVMTVLSVVSTIGVTGFFRMTDYWNEVMLTTRLNKALTHAFASITADFDTILSGRVTGSGLRGQQADTEDNVRFWRLAFEDDRITLPVEQYNPIADARERLVVQYAIERTGEDARLVRNVVDAGSAAHNGIKTSVASGITGMRIQYFDGRDWRNQWDAVTMPELVRVSLSAMDGARPDRHIARMAVFRIQVR